MATRRTMAIRIGSGLTQSTAQTVVAAIPRGTSRATNQSNTRKKTDANLQRETRTHPQRAFKLAGPKEEQRRMGRRRKKHFS